MDTDQYPWKWIHSLAGRWVFTRVSHHVSAATIVNAMALYSADVHVQRHQCDKSCTACGAYDQLAAAAAALPLVMQCHVQPVRLAPCHSTD
jgi:hypothetical protein